MQKIIDPEVLAARKAAEMREDSRRQRESIEARWAAEAKRQRELDDARLARDRAAGIDIYKQRQARHEARQKSQAEWADRRKELEADVADLNVLLRSAQGRVLTDPLEDARSAAAEVQVYEARIAGAKQALAIHESQPAV